MADLTNELNKIKHAVYGIEIRDPIVSSLIKSNTEVSSQNEIVEEYIRAYTDILTNPIDVGFSDVVSIDDAAQTKLDKLVVNVELKQDLHGYDHPWPAGGGENVLDPNLKFTAGTYFGGAVLSTQDGYNISFSGTPTESGNITTNLIATADAVVMPAGTYTSVGGIFSMYKPDGTWYTNRQTGTWTADSDFIVRHIYVQAVANTPISGSRFICLVKGTTAPTEWTPYSNICPITGWEGCEVKDEGKNLASGVIVSGSIGGTGVIGLNDSYSMAIGKIKQGQIYTLTTNDIQFVGGFFTEQPQIGSTSYDGSRIVQASKNFTAPIDGYVAFRILTGYDTYQLELGSTATSYEPYKSRTASVSFPETVYGGTVDLVTGECVVDRAMVDLGTLTWELVSSGSFTPYFKANVSSLGIKYEGGFGTTAYHILSSMYKCVARSSVEFVDKTMCADGSSTNRQVTQIQIKDSAYSDATAFKAAMSGVQVVYELAAPTTFTLTPAELELFKGANNISADAGQVTVTYRQDVLLALNKKLDNLNAIMLES